MEEFLISFPSFILWDTLSKRPMAHYDDGSTHYMIPIFTDEDSARQFIERESLYCEMVKIGDVMSLVGFLGTFKATDQIAFDPLGGVVATVTTYTVKEIMESVR